MAAMSDEEVDRALEALPGWERRGEAIFRELRFADFVASVEFVNRLVPVAEDMNHHPDLSIAYNRVAVSLTTHSEGAITDSDIALARQIEALA